MNRVEIVGRLTQEIEVKSTQAGSVCSFNIAVNRPRKKDGTEQQADFIPCVAWTQRADFLAKYAKKGDRIGVEGSIRTRSYQAQDGSMRYVTEVLADQVEIYWDRKPQRDTAKTDGEGFTEVEDDELPF